MRELLLALHVTQQRLLYGMAWRHSLTIDWLHVGWQKDTATFTGKSPEASVAKGCLQRGILLPHSCEAWSQNVSHRDSGMAVISWGTCYPHQCKIPIYCLKSSRDYLVWNEQQTGHYPHLYKMLHLISVFRTDHHLSPFTAKEMQSTYSKTTSSKYISILSFH